MEHLYAVLLLNETGAELNERNLTAVLAAAGCAVTESRTKALVAALEGVEVDEFAAPGSAGDAGDGDEAGARAQAPTLTSADDTSASPDRERESAEETAPADSADESVGGSSTEEGE